MKRIVYISRFARDLSPEEIESIAGHARARNAEEGITGILLCVKGVFYQVIEGPEDRIDQLYDSIRRDSRHCDIVTLRAESGVAERLYPQWSMRTIRLEEGGADFAGPVRDLLRVLSESHETLRRYTQPTVQRFIDEGLNPLEVAPRRRHRVIMFCDMVGFSHFSEALDVEELLEVTNCFFNVCGRQVSRRGGEVNKLIGDCVMATFREDAVNRAIGAAIDILTELEVLREKAAPATPKKVLYCGIGIAFGEVIEGNVGSDAKMEYTVLGEAVNRAERLESLTRDTRRSLLFSEDVRERASPSWRLARVCQFSLRPDQAPQAAYSLDAPITFKRYHGFRLTDRVIRGLREIVTEEPPSRDLDDLGQRTVGDLTPVP